MVGWESITEGERSLPAPIYWPLGCTTLNLPLSIIMLNKAESTYTITEPHHTRLFQH